MIVADYFFVIKLIRKVIFHAQEVWKIPPKNRLSGFRKKDPASKINILMLVVDKEDGHAVGGARTFESDVYVLNNIVNRCEE